MAAGSPLRTSLCPPAVAGAPSTLGKTRAEALGKLRLALDHGVVPRIREPLAAVYGAGVSRR